MKLSKALILLRVWKEDAIDFFQEHPELGPFSEKDDFDLSDEQYYALYKYFSEDWGKCKVSSYLGYYNDEYNSIAPQQRYIKVQDKQIEFGMILQCHGSRDPFGVLIGFFGERLYYFDNEECLELPTYQLVSFIIDDNNPDRALHVTDIDKYEIVSHADNSYLRPDGSYCDPDEWKAMIRGIPFIGMSRHLNCLFFPSKKEYSDLYYEKVLSDSYVKAINLHLYIKALSFISEIEVNDVKSKIISIRKYIDGLDYKGLIDTYQVVEDGHLQRRVGRDDHFNMTTKRTVNTNDSYIQSLLPIGEDFDYYALNSDEENYHYVNKEATEKGINSAIEKYDKDEHLAFLLKEYFDGHYATAQKLSEYNLCLKQMFGLEKFQAKVKSMYFYQYSYKTVVNRYNNHLQLY